MAAHIACHGNELLPNSFPPLRPVPSDHGMMSQYEAPFVMHRTSPLTHVEGGIGFIDDELPTLTKPAPTASITPSFDLSQFYDPALCLTPDKHGRRGTYTQKLNRGSDEGLSLKARDSQKVRFDNFVEVKQMSPERQSLISENDVTLEPSSNTDSIINHNSDLSELPDTLHSNSTQVKSYSYHSRDSESDTDIFAHTEEEGISDDMAPISVVASDWKHSGKINRIPKNQSNYTDTLVDSTNSLSLNSEDVQFSTGTSEVEHVLARPEFNSTLRVGKELKQLSETELDVGAAIKQKLKQSDKTRTAIVEKATARVNQSDASSLYSRLVSVDVREQELIETVSREKSAKVKVPSSSKHGKLENQLVSPPDIMDCLTPDLIRETASLSLEGLPSPDTNPRTSSLARAFDVYRHIRTWEDW